MFLNRNIFYSGKIEKIIASTPLWVRASRVILSIKKIIFATVKNVAKQDELDPSTDCFIFTYMYIFLLEIKWPVIYVTQFTVIFIIFIPILTLKRIRI